MKKLFCFLLCLTLIFSSISLCFASATSWDTTDQANLSAIKNSVATTNGTMIAVLGRIADRLVFNNIPLAQIAQNTYNSLSYSLNGTNWTISHWVADIDQWLSVIKSQIDNINPQVNEDILNMISSEYNNVRTSYFKYNNISTAEYLSLMNVSLNTISSKLTGSWNLDQYTYNADGSISSRINSYQFPTFLANFANNSTYAFSQIYNRLFNGFNSNQTYTSWSDITQTSSFTPLSGFDGVYKWLSKIQTPIARLSYVLASDERIEAQEAAAANEEAVVDNFIDSSGNGSASPSDIGSVSNLSSGYKQNFGSDASPAGIFDIFNSEHATWFSQETKNQLDTTTPTRLSKGSESETPLLDKQIEDIYNALGVKQP